MTGDDVTTVVTLHAKKIRYDKNNLPIFTTPVLARELEKCMKKYNTASHRKVLTRTFKKIHGDGSKLPSICGCRDGALLVWLARELGDARD